MAATNDKELQQQAGLQNKGEAKTTIGRVIGLNNNVCKLGQVRPNSF